MLLVLSVGLNAPSTASSADRCVLAGTHAGGARGFVVARPGHSVVEHIRLARAPCGTTFWVDLQGGPLHALSVVGPGWSGTIRSDATHVDGLVGVRQLETGDLRGGGDADLPALRERLDDVRSHVLLLRILLAVLLGVLAVVAPRRAVAGAAAAVLASVVLSALGSTNVALLLVLTLLGSFAPWRALWLYFAVYLAILVASPETQSLAALGPHPWGAGRFYGVSNELETLLLAPALALGLAAAPLVLLTIGWSRAGADGGGLLVYLGGYAWMLPRPRPRSMLAYAVGALGLALAFVGLDAATGGSSHVTQGVGSGPGGLAHDLWHRWGVSWHGAAGTAGRATTCLVCLGVLGWVATRRPRARLVDAFLLAIAVSLVVNDTPQDVLFWGAVTGVGLRRAV
jgi:hypothetical protein